MRLILIRTRYTDTYTEGELRIAGQKFCDTLEPARKKLFGCIKEGVYPITIDIQSPKFMGHLAYRAINYKMPRLLTVPGREGILIHPGNDAVRDSQGCILPGIKERDGYITKSRDTFFSLYQKFSDAKGKGEPITIQIIDSIIE